jgi:hypothetical protein
LNGYSSFFVDVKKSVKDIGIYTQLADRLADFCLLAGAVVPLPRKRYWPAKLVLPNVIGLLDLRVSESRSQVARFRAVQFSRTAPAFQRATNDGASLPGLIASIAISLRRENDPLAR